MQVTDYRSPWAVDTRPMGRRPGAMLRIQRDIELDEPWGLELIRIPVGNPVTLDLRAESAGEGVVISGTARADIVGECARCLDRVDDKITVDICELYAYQHSTTDETTDSDEVHRLDGDFIDLKPVVRDAIVLALPVTPYCRPDCPGLCVECGERLATLPADHSHERMDTRWAALRQLLNDEPDNSPAAAKKNGTS